MVLLLFFSLTVITVSQLVFFFFVFFSLMSLITVLQCYVTDISYCTNTTI